MSSVEIKIKGVKSVRRPKAKAKRGKKKISRALLEKSKMAEYSFRGLPYNYVSTPQPTYIDRPAPQIQQQQQQQPSIDYKPMAEMLSQQLALARLKEESSREQSMMPQPNVLVSRPRVEPIVEEPSRSGREVGDVIIANIRGKDKILTIVKDLPEKKSAVRKSAKRKIVEDIPLSAPF